MVQSFHRYWPANVELVCYTERPTKLPRGSYRILQDVPGWRQFLKRWQGDRAACGQLAPGRPVGAGKMYDYRWDAVKFARQAFIAWDAARTHQGLMAWFDGDTLTHARVPEGWAEGLLGAADVAYLGRGSFHPEIGFVAYRLPVAMPLLERWVDFYTSGSYRDLPEWHSAYTWREALRDSGLNAVDLTRDVKQQNGEIWPCSPLAAYTDHLKGNLKVRGRC